MMKVIVSWSPNAKDLCYYDISFLDLIHMY